MHSTDYNKTEPVKKSPLFTIVELWETRHFSQNQRFWKKQPNPT